MRLSRSVITSASVAPSPSTVFSPPVWVRRMVGTERHGHGGLLRRGRSGRAGRQAVVGDIVVRRRCAATSCGCSIGISSSDRLVTISTGFLGHHAVHDPVRAELSALAARGWRPARSGPAARRRRRCRVRRRVGLGRGVRVVDDDRLLVGGVHLAVQPQLLRRIEAVERRRPLGVRPSGSNRVGPVGPGRAGDDAAGLVGVVRAGVGDDRRRRGRRGCQHAAQPTGCSAGTRTPAAASVSTRMQGRDQASPARARASGRSPRWAARVVGGRASVGHRPR